jgi:hypothetical protein
MNSDVQAVLKFIEENIRVSDQTSIEYLDPQGHIHRLSYKQNQIVFGRRGSGKSLLLKSLKESSDKTCVKINLEDFKDISFPNSIIQVQILFFQNLLECCNAKFSIFSTGYWKKSRKVIKNINAYLKLLDSYIADPDEYEESIRRKDGSKSNIKGKGGTANQNIEGNHEKNYEIETSKNITFNKLSTLKNSISTTKKLINDIAKVLGTDIFLILDDFYFIRKTEQPYLVDFFHRLSKDTPLYIKVATIKHRSRLYSQLDNNFTGMELGHDAQTLNLDFGLDDFGSMVEFMKSLLHHVNSKVGVTVDYDKMITDNAFRFLCLASGGVPRDFFSLFISLGDRLGGDKSITKPNVIDKAIENITHKKDALKKDAFEEGNILEQHLKYITDTIILGRKWNSFLVSNPDVEKYQQINQAIKELVDLRFFHIVDTNISAAHSDGTRYSAYMVDIGLFPNSNPRKFQQVEPGQKDEHHREDKIRSAPKLNLEEYHAYIAKLELPEQLETSEM